MDSLLLHPHSRVQLEQFLQDPVHAVMLIAPEGSGKRSVAEKLAGALLGLEYTINLHEHPAVIYLEAPDKSIPIEAVRSLQKRLQLKSIGDRPIRRVVIIEAAQRMTTEAQNALLKLLEEPPADTVLILTATSARSVLPTIYSRVQHIVLKTPPLDEMITHFKRNGHTIEAIQQALRYSGQRLGLSHALLDKDEEHPLLGAVASARSLLQASLFERLAMIDEWSKQKDDLPARFDALQRLCQAGLNQAAGQNNLARTRSWQRYYQAVYDAQASLSHTPHTKLLLTNLFLRLS